MEEDYNSEDYQNVQDQVNEMTDEDRQIQQELEKNAAEIKKREDEKLQRLQAQKKLEEDLKREKQLIESQREADLKDIINQGQDEEEEEEEDNEYIEIPEYTNFSLDTAIITIIHTRLYVSNILLHSMVLNNDIKFEEQSLKFKPDVQEFYEQSYLGENNKSTPYIAEIVLKYISQNIFVKGMPLLELDIKYGTFDLSYRIQMIINCLIDIKNDPWSQSVLAMNSGVLQYYKFLRKRGQKNPSIQQYSLELNQFIRQIHKRQPINRKSFSKMLRNMREMVEVDEEQEELLLQSKSMKNMQQQKAGDSRKQKQRIYVIYQLYQQGIHLMLFDLISLLPQKQILETTMSFLDEDYQRIKAGMTEIAPALQAGINEDGADFPEAPMLKNATSVMVKDQSIIEDIYQILTQMFRYCQSAIQDFSKQIPMRVMIQQAFYRTHQNKQKKVQSGFTNARAKLQLYMFELLKEVVQSNVELFHKNQTLRSYSLMALKENAVQIHKLVGKKGDKGNKGILNFMIEGYNNSNEDSSLTMVSMINLQQEIISKLISVQEVSHSIRFPFDLHYQAHMDFSLFNDLVKALNQNNQNTQVLELDKPEIVYRTITDQIIDVTQKDNVGKKTDVAVSIMNEWLILTGSNLMKSVQMMQLNLCYDQNILEFQEINLKDYNYLLKSSIGVQIKQIIVQLYSTFMISPEDQLLSIYDFQLPDLSSQVAEHSSDKENLHVKNRLENKLQNPYMLFQDHDQLQMIVDNLITETDQIEILTQNFKENKINPIRAQKYLFEAYFPVIYEFCKIMGSMIDSICVQPRKGSNLNKYQINLKLAEGISAKVEQLFKSFAKTEFNLVELLGIQDLQLVDREIEAQLKIDQQKAKNKKNKTKEQIEKEQKQQEKEEMERNQLKKLSEYYNLGKKSILKMRSQWIIQDDKQRNPSGNTGSSQQKAQKYANNIRLRCYDILNVLDDFDKFKGRAFSDYTLYERFFREDVKTKQHQSNLEDKLDQEIEKATLKDIKKFGGANDDQGKKQNETTDYTEVMIFVQNFQARKKLIMEKDRLQNQFFSLLYQARNVSMRINLLTYLMNEISKASSSPVQLSYLMKKYDKDEDEERQKELNIKTKLFEESTFFFWMEPRFYSFLQIINSLLRNIEETRYDMLKAIEEQHKEMFTQLNIVNEQARVKFDKEQERISNIVKDNTIKPQYKVSLLEQIMERRQKIVETKNQIRYESSYKNFMSQLFKLIRDLFYSSTYQAFHGDLWFYRMGVFYTATDVLKNIAERNNQTFKRVAFSTKYYQNRNEFFEYNSYADQLEDFVFTDLNKIVDGSVQLVDFKPHMIRDENSLSDSQRIWKYNEQDKSEEYRAIDLKREKLQKFKSIPMRLYKMVMTLMHEHSTLLKPSQKYTLLTNDRVESIEIMARMLDLSSELINGGFFDGADQFTKFDDTFLIPDNFDPEQFGEWAPGKSDLYVQLPNGITLINKMAGLLLDRPVQDIGSNYYILVNSVIQLLLGYTEIEGDGGTLLLKQICKNAKPKAILKMVGRLMGSLYRKYKFGKNEKAKDAQNDIRDEKLTKILDDVQTGGMKQDIMRLERGDQVQVLSDNQEAQQIPVKQRIVDYKDDLVYMYNKNEEFEQHMSLELAFNLFSFYMKIIKLYPIFQNTFEDYQRMFNKQKIYSTEGWETHELVQSLKFLHYQTETIEIIAENGTPTLIQFFKVPETTYLTKDQKKYYRDQCRITDSKTKMKDLLGLQEHLQVEVNFYDFMYKKSTLLYLLTTDSVYYGMKFVCFLLGAALNILNIISYNRKSTSASLDYTTETEELVWLIINYTLVGLCSIILVMFMFTRYRLERQKAVLDEDLKQRKIVRLVMVNVIMPLFIQSTLAPSMILHIAFSLLGHLVDQVFTTLHLILIVNINVTSQYVIKSIFKNFKMLVATFILGFLLVFSYTILVADHFYNDFDDSEVGTVKVCTNLWYCYIYMINMGLRSGGGIGDVMNVIDFKQQGKFYAKLILDLTFFIFINLVVLNISFGIIIDAFSQQIDSADVLNQENLCFVCGHKKIEFEKYMPFSKHQEDHNPWKYINLLFYLAIKDPNDYTGHENYINKRMKNNMNVNWIPIGKTSYLPENEDDEMNELIQELNQLKSVVKEIKEIKDKK